MKNLSEILSKAKSFIKRYHLYIFKDVALTNLPVKGCLGIVLATGFDTSKGKLIRKVVANTQSLRL